MNVNEISEKDIDLIIGKELLTVSDLERGTQELRERLRNDFSRPKWHLLPPEGYWNDINGTIYYKGRYHVFFLGRCAPHREAIISGKDKAIKREVWLHASSRDLIHWRHHPIALLPEWDGSMPRGIYSGDMIENAPVPTIIVHIPGQGTCLYIAEDDLLEKWKPFSGNPVIREDNAPEEVIVFDPTAWYDPKQNLYFALIGNKNCRKGFEGDSTSLYRSSDLSQWEYLGPFYQSQRKWTNENYDCACPDFFPIGDKYMLLAHGHAPYYMAHFYLGHLDGDYFVPESHDHMTWPGGSLCGPETLLDEKGRRIFWGWVPEQGPHDAVWGSVATMPRQLELDKRNGLRITPIQELENLRLEPVDFSGLKLWEHQEKVLDFQGDSYELEIILAPQGLKKLYIALRRSPKGEEKVMCIIDAKANSLTIDFSESREKEKFRVETRRWPAFDKVPGDRFGISEEEWFASSQVAPLKIEKNESLKLRIFMDRSIVEIFANERLCVTQRIYPSRTDSLGISFRTVGSDLEITSGKFWELECVNSY